MTRADFYAKTLVAQVKACKRFDFDENLLYNALDTLQQVRKLCIISHDDGVKVISMVFDYLFNTYILN